jgi:hypothetical protein
VDHEDPAVLGIEDVSMTLGNPGADMSASAMAVQVDPDTMDLGPTSQSMSQIQEPYTFPDQNMQ